MDRTRGNALVAMVIAAAAVSGVAPAGGSVAGAATPAGTAQYAPLRDDTGLLHVEVPVAWSQVDTRPFVDGADGSLHPAITATTAPVFDDFVNTFGHPGVVYEAHPAATPAAELLAQADFSSECVDGGQTSYDDGVFSGTLQAWNSCDAGARAFVLVAQPRGGELTVLLWAKTLGAVDEAHLNHVLRTFGVVPSVGLPTHTAPPPVTAATAPASTSGPPAVAGPPTTTLLVPVPPVTTLASPTPPETAASTPMPPTSAPIAAPATSTAAPAGFHVITDDLARLSVQAPTWWPEVNGSPVQLDDGTWPALSATSDSDAFADGFGPGLYLREAAFSADPSVLLADYAGGSLGQDCTPGGTQPLPNPAFSGVYRSWFDCAGTLNDVHVAAANPLDGRQVTVLAFVQLTDADAPALSTILSSIRLGGI